MQPTSIFKLSKDSIRRHAPRLPGCYAVFDADGNCLYVGQSWVLRKRLLTHFIDQRDGNGDQWRTHGMTEWFIDRPFAPRDCSVHIWVHPSPARLKKTLLLTLAPLHNGDGNSRFQSAGGRVLVCRSLGGSECGVIVGESRDKTCWRIHIDGHSPNTTYTINKGYCRIIPAESAEGLNGEGI